MRNYFFTVLTWQNQLLVCNFCVNKNKSTSEVIYYCRSTYERCDLVPLVTSNLGNSELIIHFQKVYAKLFSNCYNKQGIQSNLPSYRPMNQGLFLRMYILKMFNQLREIIVGGLIPIYDHKLFLLLKHYLKLKIYFQQIWEHLIS